MFKWLLSVWHQLHCIGSVSGGMHHYDEFVSPGGHILGSSVLDWGIKQTNTDITRRTLIYLFRKSLLLNIIAREIICVTDKECFISTRILKVHDFTNCLCFFCPNRCGRRPSFWGRNWQNSTRMKCLTLSSLAHPWWVMMSLCLTLMSQIETFQHINYYY